MTRGFDCSADRTLGSGSAFALSAKGSSSGSPHVAHEGSGLPVGNGLPRANFPGRTHHVLGGDGERQALALAEALGLALQDARP